MLKIRRIVAAIALVLGSASIAAAEGRGVLLLAHGGSAEWNAHVIKLAADVDRTLPTEVAFGMATRANIQSAVDRLRARGASEITAVPLFVSSWSSVITSTEYLLGQRTQAPPELAIFARMKHSGSSPSGHDAAAHETSAHAGHVAADPKSPIISPVPIRMTRALNEHPLVAEILTSRARSISRDPREEAVVIVAHGPVGDDENTRWLSDMASLARRVGDAEPFAAIEYLTLRDDAPKPIRDRATAELRAIVSSQLEQGRRVLIVPLLVSFGGIEKGLRERLDGLAYAMPSAGLVPDDRLVTWVLAMANEEQGTVR